MHLFFEPEIKISDNTFFLSEEESKHAIKVMRLNVNDSLLILNGKGQQFECTISEPNPKKCGVKVLNYIEDTDSNAPIHIAIAPTKMNERMEWFLEKATEIGITEITPILCKNSERKVIKEERFQKIIVSALKQSKRLTIPILNPLTWFSDFIKNNPKGYIAYCDDQYEKTTITKEFKTNPLPILIGPEGDFTAEEVGLAIKSGYKTITLGKTRLRTETAGLYALMEAKLSSDEN
jgi:16S rRNA (uracil1498-N3)-methyltransferase